MSAVNTFIEKVSAMSFPNTFNPYTDTCEIYDFPQSPDIRRELLWRTLSAAVRDGVDYLWVGRDLGYRGGRRTGLALTDEVHVSAHLQRWGVRHFQPIVKGTSQSERTASVIWRMLDQISDRIYLWNVFPLHPHEPMRPLTNRAHTAAEREAGEYVLRALIGILKPRAIVAIGQDAARSAKRCSDVEVLPVRHPSYGGVRDFEFAVSERFGLQAQS